MPLQFVRVKFVRPPARVQAGGDQLQEKYSREPTTNLKDHISTP
jgi:hypothetical protein